MPKPIPREVFVDIVNDDEGHDMSANKHSDNHLDKNRVNIKNNSRLYLSHHYTTL